MYSGSCTCRSSVCNLFHITLLGASILRWLQYFLENLCTLAPDYHPRWVLGGFPPTLRKIPISIITHTHMPSNSSLINHPIIQRYCPSSCMLTASINNYKTKSHHTVLPFHFWSNKLPNSKLFPITILYTLLVSSTPFSYPSHRKVPALMTTPILHALHESSSSSLPRTPNSLLGWNIYWNVHASSAP